MCTHRLIAQHSICQVQIGLSAAVAFAQQQACVRRSPDAVYVVAAAGLGCLAACRGSRQEEQCAPADSSKHLHSDGSSQKLHAPQKACLTGGTMQTCRQQQASAQR